MNKTMRDVAFLPQAVTRDEAWTAKYDEVMAFMRTKGRNPSRYDPEERGRYCNWIKHNRKLLNAGRLKADRVERFQQLLTVSEGYRRVNQHA